MSAKIQDIKVSSYNVQMYNNVDFISETYEGIAAGKLQFVDFNHHTLRFDDSPPRKVIEYLQITYTARN